MAVNRDFLLDWLIYKEILSLREVARRRCDHPENLSGHVSKTVCLVVRHQNQGGGA